MTGGSRLVAVASPQEAEAVVLVLHGGASRGRGTPVSPWQLSVLRMIPVARRVASVCGPRTAVFRLLNSVRGWDEERSPVDDVRDAVAEVRERYGEVPVGLVGHSLGGRAALLSAGLDGVVSVVALAPWLYGDEAPRITVEGRHFLIVHGTSDRVASPVRAEKVARGLAERGADVSFVAVSGGRHAMLPDVNQFDGAAADFLASTLSPT